MSREEFENWYKEKTKHYKNGLNWFEYKARHLISNTSVPYEEANELISCTVEAILAELDKITVEKSLDSYFFIWMKNLLFNKFVHVNRRFCCEDDFSKGIYDIEVENYNLESDKKQEKNLEILKSRAESEEEKLVLNTLLSGGYAKDTGLNSIKRTQIMKKLKGEPPKRYYKLSSEKLPHEKKSKAKEGAKMGRPKEYSGVVCIKDEKIFKLYPDANSVKNDGFSPTVVRRCLKGQLKQHKGYVWKLLKDVQNE